MDMWHKYMPKFLKSSNYNTSINIFIRKNENLKELKKV